MASRVCLLGSMGSSRPETSRPMPPPIRASANRPVFHGSSAVGGVNVAMSGRRRRLHDEDRSPAQEQGADDREGHDQANLPCPWTYAGDQKISQKDADRVADDQLGTAAHSAAQRDGQGRDGGDRREEGLPVADKAGSEVSQRCGHRRLQDEPLGRADDEPPPEHGRLLGQSPRGRGAGWSVSPWSGKVLRESFARARRSATLTVSRHSARDHQPCPGPRITSSAEFLAPVEWAWHWSVGYPDRAMSSQRLLLSGRGGA